MFSTVQSVNVRINSSLAHIENVLDMCIKGTICYYVPEPFPLHNCEDGDAATNDNDKNNLDNGQ